MPFKSAPLEANAEPPPLSDLVRVAFKIGIYSFGGPAAQIALMHREFVDEKRWISEDRFLHALNYCMLLPGPEAQQLATYCGWLLHRVRGGIAAGVLFILPGALAMLGLASVYARFGSVPLVESLFYGIKAGILAIVLQALLRVGSRALKMRVAWWIAGASFLALFVFEVPFPVVIVSAAVIGAFGLKGSAAGDAITEEPVRETRPVSFARTLATGLFFWAFPPLVAAFALAPQHVLVEVAGFFSMLAVVSFGGAYALLSYMAQVAVETYGWLSAGEMLDGLGLAETTPGPLILVTEFVGFLAGYREPAPFSPLAGGVLAAAMTVWVTFAPSFLWIFLGAPYIERLRGNARLSAAMQGITAAVTGTILNLAVWFALHVFFAEVGALDGRWLSLPVPEIATVDVTAVLLAVAAVYLVFGAKRGVATVVAITALLGLASRWLAGAL
ncbi:chromate efflux transporter [Rhizobiales bacterium]|uniref:chromate efflux transporter n=1 Tax=Hongsoonwoonella zoysiae TaxID=2821844 RepID=UPI0015618375|nr:chromate efflux transporter [Hongsoonwoonella zoysiae]NRG17255.1 chromate efflux transporter [Hongsoonwoonella zoysiae]